MSKNAIIAALLLVPCIPSVCLADEVEDLFFKARDGTSLGQRERRLAKDILEQYRESETIAPGTGDPALGKALEAMSAGRRLSHWESTAINDLAKQYAAAKAEKAGTNNASGDTNSTVTGISGRRSGSLGGFSPAIVTGGAALLVLVIGAGIIVVRSRYPRGGANG